VRVADKEGFAMRKKLCFTLMLSPMLVVIGIALACTSKRPMPTATPSVITHTPTPKPTELRMPTATPMPSLALTRTPVVLPSPTQRKPTGTLPTPVPTKVLGRIFKKCEDDGEIGRKTQGESYKDLMYKKGEVVLTGHPDHIDKIVEDYISDLEIERIQSRGFILSDGTAIRLYRTTSTEDAWVGQVTCIINMLSIFGFEVAADPNYHLSPAQWAGGESPWTQNGEWTGIDGGGITLTHEIGMSITDIHKIYFLEQWAFGLEGIHLVEGGRRTVQEKGEGVRIGIFDSSPFTDWEGELIIPSFATEPEPTPFSLSLDSIRPITVTEFAVPFREFMGDGSQGSGAGEYLTVWHTVPISAPNCPGETPEGVNLEYQDLSNHGLFVAGLAHEVAPESEIYLVRVLENDGCADLYSIAESIAGFVQEMQKPGQDGPIVINLSLGVHEPPCPTSFGLPPEVKSLQRVISDTIEQGAVVVAAAGNDSYDKASPNEMEIPAREPGVIGVAASNGNRGRGCFSNEGDVAAPGGNGVEREKCRECCRVPSADDCLNYPEYCIVGPIYKFDEESESAYGYAYAYWVGTSFAAPLVSGQAALLLHSGVDPQDVPDRIKHIAMTRIAEEGGEIGIIDIWRSLP
jgi:subtilisin family serine protease